MKLMNISRICAVLVVFVFSGAVHGAHIASAAECIKCSPVAMISATYPDEAGSGSGGEDSTEVTGEQTVGHISLVSSTEFIDSLLPDGNFRIIGKIF